MRKNYYIESIIVISFKINCLVIKTIEKDFENVEIISDFSLNHLYLSYMKKYIFNMNNFNLNYSHISFNEKKELIEEFDYLVSNFNIYNNFKMRKNCSESIEKEIIKIYNDVRYSINNLIDKEDTIYENILNLLDSNLIINNRILDYFYKISIKNREVFIKFDGTQLNYYYDYLKSLDNIVKIELVDANNILRYRIIIQDIIDETYYKIIENALNNSITKIRNRLSYSKKFRVAIVDLQNEIMVYYGILEKKFNCVPDIITIKKNINAEIELEY